MSQSDLKKNSLNKSKIRGAFLFDGLYFFLDYTPYPMVQNKRKNINISPLDKVQMLKYQRSTTFNVYSGQ